MFYEIFSKRLTEFENIAYKADATQRACDRSDI
jgi:hypothetical protein